MKKILVIEDDESLLFGVTYALEKEGWNIACARTLEQATAMFQSHSYDLLLLDNHLPDGLGMAFCRSIRNISPIPIIFLTASDEEMNIVLGLENGADDYITKPFRVQELISRIRAALRRYDMMQQNARPGSNRLASNEVSVDLLAHKVVCNRNEIYLTPIEFKLLVTFLQHPQQTLTRDQILQRLWDTEGEFIDDNTLSVHIRRLREKIEFEPSHPEQIVTVRGVGYRWNGRSEHL